MHKINYNNTDFIVQQHSFNNKDYFSISISDIKLLMYFSFEEEQVSHNNFLLHIEENIQHYCELFTKFVQKASNVQQIINQKQFSNIDSDLFDFVFKHGFYCNLLAKYLDLSYNKYISLIFSQSAFTFPYFFIFCFCNKIISTRILRTDQAQDLFQTIYYYFTHHFGGKGCIAETNFNKKYIVSLYYLVPEDNKPMYKFLCLINHDNMSIDDILVESFKENKTFDTDYLNIFINYTYSSIYEKLFKYVPIKELQKVFIDRPFNINNASLPEFLSAHLKLEFENYICEHEDKIDLFTKVFTNFIHSLEDYNYSYNDIQNNFTNLFSSLNEEEYEKFKKQKYSEFNSLYSITNIIFENQDLRYKIINF